MNGTDRQQELVDDYLRRLERAAYALPPDRRAELVLEIKGHIDEAMASAPGGPTDEAWTRTVLERLGTPEEIVLSEGGAPAPPAVQTVERPAGTGLELAAVLLLTVGSIIPFVGWIAGVICLWASKRWRTWEKLLGTFVVPGGPLVLDLGQPLLAADQGMLEHLQLDGGGQLRSVGHHVHRLRVRPCSRHPAVPLRADRADRRGRLALFAGSSQGRSGAADAGRRRTAPAGDPRLGLGDARAGSGVLPRCWCVAAPGDRPARRAWSSSGRQRPGRPARRPSPRRSASAGSCCPSSSFPC